MTDVELTSRAYPRWNENARALATAMAVFNTIHFLAGGRPS